MYAKSFASDNHAGAHPAVLQAIAEANSGDAPAYGGDRWTREFEERIRDEFGPDAAGFTVLNGTGANILGLGMALDRRYDAVICPESAHIATHEAGASERILGVKLITVPTADGKLTPGDVTARLTDPDDFNAVRPRVVSISQATEMGTCYTPDEVAALAETAHAHGLLLYMDGARLANAAAFLGCSLRALTANAGVDVFSLGTSKNGGLVGEAVVALRPSLAEGAARLSRQSLQLASKMRFVSAQVSALLTHDLWRHNADHANTMARRLADQIAGLPGLSILWPVEANMVFAALPPDAMAELGSQYLFHEVGGVARWMTSFDTTEADVDKFTADIRQVLGGWPSPDRPR